MISENDLRSFLFIFSAINLRSVHHMVQPRKDGTNVSALLLQGSLSIYCKWTEQSRLCTLHQPRANQPREYSFFRSFIC